MTLSLIHIKKIIEEQKQKWNSVNVSDFRSRQECREVIENDFLSENDITDRSDEFSSEVDYDEVCNLRSDAMTDVLDAFDVKGADDYEDAIEGLVFSHYCGGCSLNNVSIEAYFIDSKMYRLVRYVKKANGEKETGIDTMEISIAKYDDLEHDYYNNIVRFQAVNTLFNDK